MARLDLLEKIEFVKKINGLLVRHNKGTLEETEAASVLTLYGQGWVKAAPALKQLTDVEVYPSFVSCEFIQYQYVVRKSPSAWGREKQELHFFTIALMACEMFAYDMFQKRRD